MSSHQHSDPSENIYPWCARDSQHELILYNDDVNTFDYVIECLMRICDHDPEQAEQCALLTHTKGWCVVKTASEDVLRGMCSALTDSGLTAMVE